MIAKGSVNASSAVCVGAAIAASMKGLSVTEHKFSRKDQMIEMVSTAYVAVDREKMISTQNTPSCC